MTRLLVALAAAAVFVGIGIYVTMTRNEVRVAPRKAPDAPSAEHGAAAFIKYGCGGCHEIDGVRAAEGKVGPPLGNVGERAYLAGRLPNTPENMVRWIVDPQGIDPGNAMPDLRVTEEDARSMAEYLYSLTRRR